VQIASIGVVVAIGTGLFAGLSSTGRWRTLSNDASFAVLHMHDLHVALQLGTFAPAGALAAAARSIDHADDVAALAERLVIDAQVDASDASDTVLVGARIVGATGLASGAAPAPVDTLWLSDGARPAAGGDTALLEVKFARYYGLPTIGSLTVAGGATVDYSGFAVAPDDFSIVAQEGSVMAEADLATLYLDLDAAQRLTGRAGTVNDLVLTLRPGADAATVGAELVAAIETLGVVSPTLTTRDQNEAYRVLYDDIDTDQQMWNILSVLVLGAAALAAVNLISRAAEAQRREIGIGMALGLPRWQLGVRPALIGVEVGLVGVVAGIGIGLGVGALMRGLLESLLPALSSACCHRCWPRWSRCGGPCGWNRPKPSAPDTWHPTMVVSARGPPTCDCRGRAWPRCPSATCCVDRAEPCSLRWAWVLPSPRWWLCSACSTASRRPSTRVLPK
jgi:putative ABC transport system permease protein